jgi:hypothetical protein
MFNSFAEEVKVVNILPPKDISAAAHSTAYVDVQNYQHVTFIVSMGATGAVGSSKNITLKQAKSTSGSSAANLPIGKYWHNGTAIGSASIANDTYAAASVASSGAAVALTASSNNIVYMFEIDTSKLSASMDAVGIGVATTSAAALCGATAILSKARYLSSSPPSAL